jgi:hypothetical protein
MHNSNEQITYHKRMFECFDRKWRQELINDLHKQKRNGKFGVGINQ